MRVYYRIGNLVKLDIGYNHFNMIDFQDNLSYYEDDEIEWKSNWFESEEDAAKFIERLSSEDCVIQKFYIV